PDVAVEAAAVLVVVDADRGRVAQHRPEEGGAVVELARRFRRQQVAGLGGRVGGHAADVVVHVLGAVRGAWGDDPVVGVAQRRVGRAALGHEAPGGGVPVRRGGGDELVHLPDVGEVGERRRSGVLAPGELVIGVLAVVLVVL